MLKTGEKIVDEILEMVGKHPAPARDKISALMRVGQLAGVYANETNDDLWDRVFGSTPGDVLQQDGHG